PGDDRGFPWWDEEVGVDRRSLDRSVGGEERGVGDEPEAFLDLHRPEAVAADADHRQAVDLEGAAWKREDAPPAIEIRGDRDALTRASPDGELPRLAVGVGLDGGEARARGDPHGRVVHVVARLAQEERHTQPLAGFD